MPLTLPDILARRVPPRQRRRIAGALSVLAATALLAAAVPMPAGETATTDRAGAGDGTVFPTAEEDLTAFLDTKRWGRSLREIQEERAAAEAAAAGAASRLNPVLVEMGYVGLIVTPEYSAMLLTLPTGQIARLTLGDQTPDGRTLSSLTDNTLTLTAADGSDEVLELFPRPIPVPEGDAQTDG